MAPPESVVSLRGILVLVAALAVVVGVLVWAGKKPPEGAPAPERAPLVAKFEEKSVARLDAACGETRWTAERSAAGWRIGSREADLRRVHDVIAAVQDALVSKIVADRGIDRKAYALDPGCTLALALDSGEKRAVRLGRTSPVGAERYAELGDGRLALTDGSLYGMIDRDASALEEKRLFPVDAASIHRISVLGPAGPLVLEADEGSWRVVAPFEDRGSESACSRLATAVTSLAVDRPEAGPPHPPTGPRIAIELTAGESGPTRAAIAAVSKDDKRFAWRDDGSLAGSIPEATVRDLDLTPDAYRERRIASFSTPDVRSVSVARGPLGLEATRGEGGTWSGRDGGTAFATDPAPIDTLVGKVAGLTASGFAGSTPPTAPTGTLVVRGDAGELAHLTWGPLAPQPGSTAESVWVTAADRPGVVFRVPATSLGPMPSKASEWTAAPKGK